MPGFRAHYLFGKITKAGRIIPAAYKYQSSFSLGLQGPDVFFFSPLAHLLYEEHLGGVLHAKNTGKFFASLIASRNSLWKNDTEARKISDSFISGFIGHYTLDCTVHPYVHYRTMKLKNSHRPNYVFGIHVLLETDMDMVVLKRLLGMNPGSFRCADTISLSKKEQKVICALLADAISRTYPFVHIFRWQVAFAIKCFCLGNILLHDYTGRKKSLLRRLDERIIGNAFLSSLIAVNFHKTYDDPCNLLHRLWKNPWDPSFSSRESVFDMMRRAKKTYRKRLMLYRSYLSAKPKARKQALSMLLSELGSNSYDTGLAVL